MQETRSVIQRATQSPDYWGQKFSIQPDDLDYLLNKFLDDELPRSADELALELMRFRCQREETLLSRELVKGSLYQPKASYQVGEQIVFPALQFAVGKVVDMRDGVNPEVSPFKVIQVEMQNGGTREFAAEYNQPHRLNADANFPDDQALLSPEELFTRYGKPVAELLVQRLETSPDFVRLAGKWFPRSLIAEVNAGHLNLAEAVLDVAQGGPLPTEVLLKDIGMPAAINRQLQIFSLNYALQKDERFDEVGPAGDVLWFLRRLQPPEVLYQPPRLMAADAPYDRSRLDSSMLRIEREIDDELSSIPVREEAYDELTFVLTFPHRRVGTVPLSPRIARLFPTGRTHRIRFMFEDARTGHRWPGWVVREHQYAFGLETWYEANEVPAGAYIELQRGDEPGVVMIDLQGRRLKRDWVRVAQVRDGRLIFEMLKRPIACDYDELMVIIADDLAAVDEVWLRAEKRSLRDLIGDLFPELAKLSPQGTVHARSMYAAVNMLRRVAPGPLFAEWSLHPSVRIVGDGYAVSR
jgi:hypothetical protein